MWGKLLSGLYVCTTCNRLFPDQGFCSCRRELTPIIDGHKSRLKSSPAKARPGSSSLLPDPTRLNLSGGGTSTMHNYGSGGEVIGVAHEDGNIEMECMHSPGHTLHHPAPTPTLANVSNDITSEPSQADLSASDSPPTVKSSRQLQQLSYSLDRDHSEPNLVLNVPFKDSDIEVGGMHSHSSDRVPSEPRRVLQAESSSHGFAHEDSDMEMGDTHSSDRVPSEPRRVLQGESSSHGFAHEDSDMEMGDTHSSDRVPGEPRRVLQGESSSHGFAHEDRDMEMGGTPSSDGVPGEPRLVDPRSHHLSHEDTWQRSATMLDPLLTVSFQGACSLVAYKSSDGSSLAKDVLCYLVVFSYVLGFLSALVGKLYRSSKMVVIGWVATALGFLLTMALVVIYKI